MINYLAGPGRLTLHAGLNYGQKTKPVVARRTRRTSKTHQLHSHQDAKPWIAGFSSRLPIANYTILCKQWENRRTQDRKYIPKYDPKFPMMTFF